MDGRRGCYLAYISKALRVRTEQLDWWPARAQGTNFADGQASARKLLGPAPLPWVILVLMRSRPILPPLQFPPIRREGEMRTAWSLRIALPGEMHGQAVLLSPSLKTSALRQSLARLGTRVQGRGKAATSLPPQPGGCKFLVPDLWPLPPHPVNPALGTTLPWSHS